MAFPYKKRDFYITWNPRNCTSIYARHARFSWHLFNCFFGFIFCFVAFTLIFFLRFCIRKQIRNNRRLNGNKAVGVLLSKSLFIPNTEVKTQRDLHRSKGPTALMNFRVIWVIRFSTRSIQVDPRLARESHDIVKKKHTHRVHQLVCDLNPLLRLGYFSLYFANKKYFIIFNPRV